MSENIPEVDRSKRCMLSGKHETPEHTELRPDGMQKDYVVLCPDERAKGFVRPVRRSYIHKGIKPKYPLRDLTPGEHETYNNFYKFKYLKYEEYPEGQGVCGKFWTQEMLDSGCGQITTMGLALAETYARDPKFYGGTFCATCRKHYGLEEFTWEDGEVLGS